MRHAAPKREEPNLTEQDLGNDVQRASHKQRRLSNLFAAHSEWRRHRTLSTCLHKEEIEGTKPMPKGLTERECAVFHYRLALGK